MWEKVRVKANGGADIEIITAVLIDNGIAGMEIVDSTERINDLKNLASAWDYADEALLENDNESCVIFYVPNGSPGCYELLSKIKNELLGLKITDIAVENSYDYDWVNERKKHFKPIKIGNVVVVPEWEEYTPIDNEVEFKIDPGAAFGTGQHESTSICIKLMQPVVAKGDIVLDIGCGSGILSCISSLLGASEVDACDIDAVGAISATKKNASLNNISNINVFACDAFELNLDKKYDVIIANIVADVIMDLTPNVLRLLKNNGKFISSGIVTGKVGEVKRKFKDAHLSIDCEHEVNGWHGFVVTHA